jgi:hypothetical protein
MLLTGFGLRGDKNQFVRRNADDITFAYEQLNSDAAQI